MWQWINVSRTLFRNSVADAELPMTLEYTRHALHVMAERMIPAEWVELAVSDPTARSLDPNDPEVERFFRPISEQSDRVLRVAVNTRTVPWRVVSVFFDRAMKGRI